MELILHRIQISDDDALPANMRVCPQAHAQPLTFMFQALQQSPVNTVFDFKSAFSENAGIDLKDLRILSSINKKIFTHQRLSKDKAWERLPDQYNIPQEIADGIKRQWQEIEDTLPFSSIKTEIIASPDWNNRELKPHIDTQNKMVRLFDVVIGDSPVFFANDEFSVKIKYSQNQKYCSIDFEKAAKYKGWIMPEKARIMFVPLKWNHLGAIHNPAISTKEAGKNPRLAIRTTINLSRAEFEL